LALAGVVDELSRPRAHRPGHPGMSRPHTAQQPSTPATPATPATAAPSGHPPHPLAQPPEALYRACESSELDMHAAGAQASGASPFGQARAAQALQLALEIPASGYNAFVLGPPGSSRHALVEALLHAHAATQPPAPDWVYLYNFADPNRPRALSLPPGEGGKLRDAMQRFVGELGRALATAFEGDEYRSRLDAIQADTKQREEQALQALGTRAAAQGVALLRTPQGFAFAPMKDGEPLATEAFEALSEDERERLGRAIQGLRDELHQLLHELPRMRRQMQSRLREATRETMALAAGHLIDELRERFAHLEPATAFLGEVLQDILDAGEQLRTHGHDEDDASPAGLVGSAEGVGAIGLTGSLALHRYRVNLLVGSTPGAPAPVVVCDHPTVANLIGRIDHTAHMGTLLTDFTLVRAGALHRANGGSLVLDALKVLSEPWSWPALKRALRAGEVRIESLPQMLGWLGTVPLEPEPVPLMLKVVMVGEREQYYMLQALDPEFGELFRIAADVEDDVERHAGHTAQLAALLAAMASAHGLRPLQREAVARLVEHGARMAQDAARLSTRTGSYLELLHEADACARRAGRDQVQREDVNAALAARLHRIDRLHTELLEAITRGTLIIHTSGAQVGQVNGLAYTELGELRFAYPVRVTATARLGDGELLDIERESTLGGPIHSKGVMILSAFLAARYAQELPLSLSASLVFEQSYGPIEGDSASLAELCALLSALAVLPIRQPVAVTGSVNQFGTVQAVGGINEKIEGFFALCRARGLQEEPGVIIPQANVQHLMLNEEVVQAVRQGRFHVWAVEHIDQAIELLTGVPAGAPDAKGQVPPGSVNHRVASQLTRLSVVRQAWGALGEAHQPRRGVRGATRTARRKG
jgi:predicted ATP-dependent protease